MVDVNEFVLLCYPEAVFLQKKYLKFPCKIETIGELGNYLDFNHDFLEKYEIAKNGAILVWPEEHVAWRSRDEQEKVARFSWLH